MFRDEPSSVSGSVVRPRLLRRAESFAAAIRPIVERLEERRLMFGDGTTTQPVPFNLDFNTPAGGTVLDKDGETTGFTYVYPKIGGGEYLANNLDVDMAAGTLALTTTGTTSIGGINDAENNNTNAAAIQFNGKGANGFSVVVRLTPNGGTGATNFSNLTGTFKQQGIIFGPDFDNYVKLVIGTPNSGAAIQLYDERLNSGTYSHTFTGAASEVPLTTALGAGKTLADVTSVDLKLSVVYSTGKITAYYRLNDGLWIAMPQTITLSATDKERFFTVPEGGTAAISRAGIFAQSKNSGGNVTVKFDNFNLLEGTPDTVKPKVTTVRPAAGATGVFRDAFVGTDLFLPNGAGVDKSTLLGNVTLVRVSDNKPVDGVANTSGGGDVIVFTPDGPLDANTQYRFAVSTGVRDTAGFAFEAFSSTFTTGATFENPVNSSIAFNKVAQLNAQGLDYSSVTFGPDGKLYAATLDGLIQRFTVDANGNLSAPQNISTIIANNGGDTRMIVGLTFDPTSTASNLKLWVTHAFDALENAPDWSSKLSLLSGSNLQNYQDYVVNLPRSFRDHLSNSIAFKPGDNNTLYFSQGSMSSTGRKDSTWGNREEHMLSAAIIKVNLPDLINYVTTTGHALDVKTEQGGTYNPFAPGAIVSIYADGVRNAYDLVWANVGGGNYKLVTITNGSGGGGNTPGYPNTITAANGAQRLDGSQYTGPNVPQLTSLPNQPDLFYTITEGGYYGHPNPWREEFAMQGGNPTAGVDPFEITQYPVGTQPDTNWRGLTDTFLIGNNYSADGMIQYHGTAFGGILDGAILTTRYSGGDDIIALKLDANGHVTQKLANISGFTGFEDPLDLTQDPVTGFIYVIENAGKKITLLKPGTPGPNLEVDKTSLYYNDYRGDSTATRTQTVTIKNTGTSDLTINSIALSGTNASLFTIASKPANGSTIAAGGTALVTVTFKATSSTSQAPSVATLTINTNDPDGATATVALRGIATLGTSGGNEPSLQRVLDLYQIPINTGTTNANNTYLVPPTITAGNPYGLVGEEQYLQHLTKADASQPVTMQVLGVFGNVTSPAMTFGYYGANNPETTQNEMFSVGSADAQWVNPTINGLTTFDPGQGVFGLYTTWPSFRNTNDFGNRVAYSDDQLNTFQTADLDKSSRRKFRFFPLKDSNGAVVPNAYVVGVDEYNVASVADYNDIVFIIRNVQAAPAAPTMVVDNTDDTIQPDVLSFNRINTPAVADSVHDKATVRIRNTGTAPLVVNSVTIATGTNGPGGTASWVKDTGAPTTPFTVAANSFVDVPIKFVATTGGVLTGTVTITSNDPNNPTKVLSLVGYRQSEPEGNNEPDLQQTPSLFGFTTVTTGANGSANTNDGQYLAIGEEILNDYWYKADNSTNVYVRALSGMRNNTVTSTSGSAISWFKSGTTTYTSIVSFDGNDYQSLYPRKNVSSGTPTAEATGYFNPTTSKFGFKVITSLTDHTKNPQRVSGSTSYGHEVRVYAVKDANGQYIPNTYLLCQNFGGVSAANFDYQDSVWLVSNIRPAAGSKAIATPIGLGWTSSNTVGTTLNWQASTATDLAGYNIYRSTSATTGFTKLTGAPINQTQFTDYDAAVGTTYYYRVTAVNNAASPIESFPASVKATRPAPVIVKPLAPQNLVVVATSGTTISVSWQDVADEASYIVERSPNGTDNWAQVGSVVADETTFTDSGLTPQTQYYYRVRGVNSAGEGPNSTVGNATTPAIPLQITGVNATPVSGFQVDLTWNNDAFETGFEIERSANGSDGWTNIANVAQDVLAYSDTSVVFGTTYFYRIRGTNDAGSGPYSDTVQVVTPVVPPAAPAGVAASAVASDKINVTWNDVFGETGYLIERSANGTDGWATAGTVGPDVLTFQDSGLTSNTTYYYRVSGQNTAGIGTPSTVVNAATYPPAPAAPTTVTATVVTAYQVDVTWDDVTGEANYVVERSTDGGTNWSTLTTVGADVTTYSDTTTAPLSSYLYRVSASNLGGASATTLSNTAATPLVPPVGPTTLTATTQSGTQIQLSFGNTQYEDNIEVWRSTDGTSFSLYATIAADSTSYTDTGATPATMFYYQVRGTNTAGNGDFSPIASSFTAPAQVTGVSASTNSPTAITVTWTNVTGETGYQIERSLDGSTGWTAAGTAGVDATSFADSGLDGGTTYFYRVRAVNNGGNGQYSDNAQATTFALPPSSPASLTATASTTSANQITLTWSDVAGESSYLVERSLDGSTGWALVGATGANVTTLTNAGLNAGTKYYYRVRGNNLAGEGTYSPVANATTRVAGPTSVTAVAAGLNVNLTWTSVATATGYKIERSTDGTNFTQITTTAVGVLTFQDQNLQPSTLYYYRVKASTSGLDSAFGPGVSTTTGTAAFAPIRIDSGDDTPSAGWIADQYFVGGTQTSPTTTAVGNTTEDAVYQSRRYIAQGSSFQYAIPVPNGSYTLKLHVAEMLYTGTGQRKFDVFAEGTQILNDYDIFAEFGAKNAGVKTFAVTVNDGVLDLNFTSVLKEAIIAGVEVLSTVSSTPPTTPSGLNATAISASQINLAWSDVSDETGYKIERSTSPTDGFVQIGTTSANVVTFSDTTASPNTQYYYRVRSAGLGGDSTDYSNVANATTNNAAPATPTGVSAVGASQTQIQISWVDVANETSYLVERSADGSSGWTSVGTTLADSTTITDSGLSAGVTYFYRVTAINGVGPSAPSAIDAGTTIGPAPAIPSPLNATAVTYSRIDLSWTNVAGETGYRVERSLNGIDGWSLLGNTGADATTLSDLTVAPNTTYYYRVRAFNAGGNSDFTANASATTPTGPSATPTGLAAVGTSQSAITLTWNDVAGETGYKIEKKDSTGTFVEIATVGADVTTYVDSTGNSPETAYTYRIRSYNGVGNSGYTSEVTASTQAVPFDYILDNTSATGVTKTGTWTTSTSDAGFFGTNYIHDGNASKGSRSVRYTPTIARAGAYEVFLWYPAKSNRSNIVPVTVTGSDGATTITVNQQINGSQWFSLGLFNFAVGTTGNVLISNTGTGAYVIADAVRFLEHPGGPIVPPPAAPATASAVANNYQSATVTWANVDNEAGYKIERKTGVDGVWAEIAQVGANVTSYNNTGLTGSTTYIYRVRGYASGGDGLYSPEATVTTPAAPAVGEYILDNTSAGVTKVGSWTVSTSDPGYLGANYWHDGNTGKGSKSVTYTPDMATGGVYEVFMWYPAKSSRSNLVPVTVTSATGDTTVTVNEQINGGQWFSIGQYTFNAGTGGKVTISNTGTGSYVVADGVRFLKISDPVSDPPAQVTGLTATASQGKVDLSWSDTATETGYKIERRLTSSAAWAEIATVGANVTSYSDTTVAASTGYTYRVRGANTAGNGLYSSEVPVTTPDAPAVQTEYILDNTSAGVTKTGTWTTSTSDPGYLGSNYLHDGNAGKGSKSVTYTPTLEAGGTYEVFMWYPAKSSRSNLVPVTVTSAAGDTTVVVNEQINGGQWFSIGTYTFVAGTSGKVKISNTGTGAYVVADGVRFLKV